MEKEGCRRFGMREEWRGKEKMKALERKTKTGINVKNEQLRKRGRERDGKKKRTERRRLPQDCANPSNPDTS